MATAGGSDTFEHPTRVILLVEATAAANASWRSTRKWLDTILQMLDKDSDTDAGAQATAGQQEIKQEAGTTSKVPKYQYALIVYGTHDRSTPAPVQVSGWTPSLQVLVSWLDGIQFVGGVGSKGTAMAHALAEAIVLSKTPYPGGAKPAAAAASHPDVLSVTDQATGAHTHLVLVCPTCNPCRLPLAWPCAADTKHALYTSKRYHTFIEKFKALHADKTDRVTGSLFGQLDFINVSLNSITPGTADVWDLLLSLARHRLSLSIVSARTQAARTMLELFAYGNYCLSGLKQACQRGLVFVSSMSVPVYLSPMFVEAQRAFKPLMQKLLLNAKKKQHLQQREAQQAGAHANAQAQRQQQQQQQQQPLRQPQQQQQQSMQQAPQQQMQQQPQQQQQVQQQQQQQPQQQQQQQWQTAQAGGLRPATPMQQQQHAVQQGLALQNQATQQQHQQQRVAVQGQAAPSIPQQQQQAAQVVQQQQQQALYANVSMPLNVAAGQAAGMPMQQQQAAAVQVQVQAPPGVVMQQPQAQPQMVMMVQHPQLMMQQPQQMMPGLPNFMPQQQAQQQQMMQQQQMLQQQQQAQQQVQMPMAGAAGQQSMAPAAAAAGPKPEKQRQAFWRGQVMLHLPDLGVHQQVAADVELTSTAAANMMASWSSRRTMIMTEMITVANIKQYVQPPAALKQSGHSVTRVYYKVLQQHPAFNWLQNQVYSRPDKQVILLANITPQLKGLLVVGAQLGSSRNTAQPQVNMLEGGLILSGVGQ